MGLPPSRRCVLAAMREKWNLDACQEADVPHSTQLRRLDRRHRFSEADVRRPSGNFNLGWRAEVSSAPINVRLSRLTDPRPKRAVAHLRRQYERTYQYNEAI